MSKHGVQFYEQFYYDKNYLNSINNSPSSVLAYPFKTVNTNVA